MKNSIVLAIALLLATAGHAQDLTRNFTPRNQRYGFYMGYYGNKINEAGFQVGVENYFATTPNYQVIGSLFSTFFGKKEQYYSFVISPRIGLRYTAGCGLTLESHVGFGYTYRHFNYDQYDLNNKGEIVDKGKAGISSMMPNFAFGLGYDFSRKANLPLKLYTRPSCNLSYPEGHILFQASYALEVGVIYVPTFNKHKPKND
jgi:hypothetical protein